MVGAAAGGMEGGHLHLVVAAAAGDAFLVVGGGGLLDRHGGRELGFGAEFRAVHVEEHGDGDQQEREAPQQRGRPFDAHAVEHLACEEREARCRNRPEKRIRRDC